MGRRPGRGLKRIAGAGGNGASTGHGNIEDSDYFDFILNAGEWVAG